MMGSEVQCRVQLGNDQVCAGIFAVLCSCPCRRSVGWRAVCLPVLAYGWVGTGREGEGRGKEEDGKGDACAVGGEWRIQRRVDVNKVWLTLKRSFGKEREEEERG